MSDKIAITLGEPAGIGVELVVKLALQNKLEKCVIVGDKRLLQSYIKSNNLPVSINPDDNNTKSKSQPSLFCHHIPVNAEVSAGQLNVKNSLYVLELLNHSIEGCIQGKYSAIVTCPLHKGIINEAGINFTGHTEYLAAKTNTQKVVMMLLNQAMRVALVTTHMPLKEVHKHITEQNLTETLDILIHDMQSKFSIRQPRIALCGLNPHAGEDGHLGMEEINVINPVINKYQKRGYKVYGSFPADTLFIRDKLKNFDAVLAMYHDQGLTPLKYAGFGRSVNITLGLPFIRTSVDHGTALDIAGKNIASPDSLEEAINLTQQLSGHVEKN